MTSTFRVEELATATGLAVDTIRYYQSRGLLDPPTREGRTAVYNETH
ncbi:MAG: MerR family transcriptional regulator, partial [Acidimicrobiia bacterium]|nr:MerR family transcriptional regulator [Acidimicrobiia bacterium]